MTVTPKVTSRRHRGFPAFWGSQILSALGDSFTTLAVPLLVLESTGSVAKAGLLTGAMGTAAVGAGLFAGVVVDRVDRWRLLVACDLARMLLLALVSVLWVTSDPPIWTLFVLLPMASAVGTTFQVGAVTAVRSLVGREEVTRANGRLFAGTALAAVAGPAAAGAVSGLWGPAWAIGVDAGSFGLSALLLLLVRIPDRAPTDEQQERPWRAFLAGARFLLRHPVLRPLTGLLTVFIMFVYGVDDLVVYHLKHDLGQEDDAVGLVLTAGAVGTVVGALMVARLRVWLGFGACWIGSVTVTAVAVAALGLPRGPGGVAALVALYFAGMSVGGICSMSLRQQITPEHMLGRVTSAFWTIHFSLGGVGAAAFTLVGERYGASSAFVLIGSGCLVVALCALATPVRRSQPS